MRILWEITKHPGWGIEELVDELGWSVSALADAIDEMLEAGMLEFDD